MTPEETIDEIIDRLGLRIIHKGDPRIEEAVLAVMGESVKLVEDVKNGKQSAIGPLIGKVLKIIPPADPQAVKDLLIERINA